MYFLILLIAGIQGQSWKYWMYLLTHMFCSSTAQPFNAERNKRERERERKWGE
jgi:hypothetical protein